jgi:hypothetical protein
MFNARMRELRFLPFGRVMRVLIRYFESLHLMSDWNPVNEWRDIGLEEGPAKIQEHTEPDWTKIVHFILLYYTELLVPSQGIPEPFRHACREYLHPTWETLCYRDQNLSSMVEAAARRLHSAIPPDFSFEPARCDSSVSVGDAPMLERITATGQASRVQSSGECGRVIVDVNASSDLIHSDETVPGHPTAGERSKSRENSPQSSAALATGEILSNLGLPQNIEKRP